MPINRPIEHYDGRGNLIGTTPLTIQDNQLRAEAAIARLVNGRSQLRDIRNQSQTFSNGSGALTLAQLTVASRQMAGAVAVLTQTLMDIEIVAAYNEDDGQE